MKPEITGKFMVENKDIVVDSLNIVGDDKVPMPINEQSRSNQIEQTQAQAKEATAQEADGEAKLKTEADAVIEIYADPSSESKAVFMPGSNANPTKENSSGSNDCSIRSPSFNWAKLDQIRMGQDLFKQDAHHHSVRLDVQVLLFPNTVLQGI